MRAWLLPIALFSAALCGCTTLSQPTARVLSGQYTMVKGGFNEALNVQLAADGSYVLEHELFSCVIGLNGELPLTFAREEGTWALDGKVVVLLPRARTKDFPEEAVFAPGACWQDETASVRCSSTRTFPTGSSSKRRTGRFI